MFADTYVDPLVADPTNDADAVARLFAIQRSHTTPEYSVQAFQADITGARGLDLSASLVVNTADTARWDCTQDVNGNVGLTLDSGLSLQWGADIVAVYQLVRSVEFNQLYGYRADVWQRFAVGHFVLTSPGFDDMDAADVRGVTGFDKNYLLQNQPTDSFSFAAASTYKAAVQSVFLAAGLITADLSEVCDFPGDWPAKTLPGPVSYPLDGSISYLSIVNDLLKASGCRPLFGQPSGRWMVQYIPTVATQPLRWSWAASEDPSVTDGDLDSRIVLHHQSRYQGDVHNLPNQWVFVQAGLTFEPTGSDGSAGRYIVNNTMAPPSDQTTVGRVLRSTQFLPASGAADLIKQGDAIVATALSQVEKISLQTAPWPAARHYDVFQLTHAALPSSAQRRVQAQGWTLPLWGGPMSWDTNVGGTL